MEQIRLIKEMRNECARQLQMRGADVDFRLLFPRYMVWENVAGAFSSNKGEDFRCVLEETAKIADENARIPGLEGGQSGHNQDSYWETDIRLLGGYMICSSSVAPKEESAYVYLLTLTETPQERFYLNCGEKPLIENPSKLSQILESNPDAKYNLSARACQGILSRAERRGKELPPMLKEALEKQSGGGTYDIRISSDGTKNWRAHCYETDISRNLDTGGEKPDSNHGGVAIVFEPGSASRVGGHVYSDDKSGTLRANAGDNQQSVVYGMTSYESNSMKSGNPHSGIYEADTTRTLDNNGGNPACNQGGMIVLEGNGSRDSHKGDGFKESDTMYTLNTVEQHAVCTGLDSNNLETTGDVGRTITADGDGLNEHMPTVCLNPWDAQSKRVFVEDGVCGTLNSGTTQGKNIVPSVIGQQGEKEGCVGVDAYNHTLSGDIAVTLNASSGDSPSHSGPSVMTFDRPAVCLNPWDVQSKHIQPEDGKAEALYSGECRGGGGESYVMCLNDQDGSQKAESDRSHITEKTFANDAYDKFSESDSSATLKQSGGIYGGGQSPW